ncbi:MAG: hypothetical protein EOO51_08070 [Flavobacterium sp.]|nr:MAG: hypothetical protein EOO51_08070 [Flavobacterium sp.]
MEFTEEEFEAFHIVRKIVSHRVNPERITRSEAKGYLAVQLDNNRHRTICRLYLLGKHKYIGTLNYRKVETRTRIESIHDIGKFAKPLTEIVDYFERGYIAY